MWFPPRLQVVLPARVQSELDLGGGTALTLIGPKEIGLLESRVTRHQAAYYGPHKWIYGYEALSTGESGSN